MGALLQINVEANTSHPFHIQYEAKEGSLDVVAYDVTKADDKKITLTETARFSIPCTSKDSAVDFLKHIRWTAGKGIDALNARTAEMNAAFAVAAKAAEAAPVEEQLLNE